MDTTHSLALNHTNNHAITHDYYKRPRQARGIEKFNLILNALEELILEKGSVDISLYDVIDKAQVSQGSVYHFFPSIQAALIALLERYDIEINQHVQGSYRQEEMNSWQDIIRHQSSKSLEYLNHKPVALILFMGPGQNWETRLAEADSDHGIVKTMVDAMQKIYHIPESPNPHKIMLNAVKILEALWELSYMQHGIITKEFSDETLVAMFSYLGIYWPQDMEKIKKSPLS